MFYYLQFVAYIRPNNISVKPFAYFFPIFEFNHITPTYALFTRTGKIKYL